jgi:hypothetical protein
LASPRPEEDEVNLEAEIKTSQAEALALQAVTIALCKRLLAARPELAPVFCEAFEDAERLMSGITVKVGKEAPVEVTVGALRVIEEIRSAVISDESVCRG